jgi:alcohol dehydrogenase class IV
VEDLCGDLGIPPLGHWGVSAADVSPLAAQATESNSMKANPVTLTPPELEALLTAAI